MTKRLLISGYKSFELTIFDNKSPGVKYIKKAIEKHLRQLLNDGLEWVITSGQLGVELWAAEVVLELKEEYPELQLAIITPYLEQESKWKEETQEYYRNILSQADFVNSVSKKTYEGPWQLSSKNKFLLDNSDGLLLVYDEEKEGSPKYIKEEALKQGKQSEYNIIIINGYDLQSVVEEEQLKEYESIQYDEYNGK